MSVTEVFTLIRHLIDYEAPKQDGHDETTSGRRQLCAVLIVALSYYYRYFMHLEYKAMFIISSQNEHKSFIKNNCACLNYQAILHSKRGEKICVNITNNSIYHLSLLHVLFSSDMPKMLRVTFRPIQFLASWSSASSQEKSS